MAWTSLVFEVEADRSLVDSEDFADLVSLVEKLTYMFTLTFYIYRLFQTTIQFNYVLIQLDISLYASCIYDTHSDFCENSIRDSLYLLSCIRANAVCIS